MTEPTKLLCTVRKAANVSLTLIRSESATGMNGRHFEGESSVDVKCILMGFWIINFGLNIFLSHFKT